MPNNLDKVKNIKFNELNSTIEGTKQFLVTYDCGDNHLAEVIFIEERKRMTPNKYLKLAEKEFNKRIASKASTTFFTKKKIIAFAVAGAIAVAAAVTIPCVLLLGNKSTGITYDLLWDTKITPLKSNLVVDKPNDGITTIYKEVDGQISNDLKVLLITDLHLDHKRDACNYTYTMMAKNIMNVKPDLVIFGGDNVVSIENEPRTRQFCELLEDLNVYWSFVLGNHEGREYPEKPMLSRQQMVDIFTQYPHCLINGNVKHTNDGNEVWGYGNGAINVLDSNKKVVQTLFFLDSGAKMSDEDWKVNFKNEVQRYIEMGKAKATEVEFYDYLRDNQITWYSETMDKVHKDFPDANSTVFSHVPTKDIEDAYLKFARASIPVYFPDKNPETDIGIGSSDKIWPYTDFSKFKDGVISDVDMVQGIRSEEMCYSPHDLKYYTGGENDHTAIFNAMIEKGGKHPAFFCGHDHQDNFVLTQAVNDVTLTMGYIQPACYSSNNFWTKGMLGWNPLKEPDKYHLIQGYTEMNMTLANPDSPFMVQNYDNYTVWGEDLYKEGLDLIALSRSSPAYTPAWDFKNHKSTYSNDPNDPLQLDPPTLI